MLRARNANARIGFHLDGSGRRPEADEAVSAEIASVVSAIDSESDREFPRP